MYHICMKSCLSYFVQWILFMVRYIYARDLITVLNFWSIFAMQLKMIFWVCIFFFCCCSKIQLTEASISIRNASARVKHLVHGDMSRNTATNSVYNKCGMTFVMKRNKNWAHSWNGQTLPCGVIIVVITIIWGEPLIALDTKKKAKRNNGSILLTKASSFFQNQRKKTEALWPTPKEANKFSYKKVDDFWKKKILPQQIFIWKLVLV